MKRSFAAAFAAMLLVTVSTATATSPTTSDLVDRLNQLEAETQGLRAELEWMRSHPVRLPAVEQGTPVLPASMSRADQRPAAEVDYFTLPELRGEMKRFAWSKGDFRIIPYGYLWASMIYETSRTNPGAYTVWVFSDDDEGEDNFVVDIRRTRLGLDIEGPAIPLLNLSKSSGRVEIDFQSPTTSIDANRPTVLLRQAYWEGENDNYKLLIGQTWDVISPLYPGMLLYTVGWDAGNIGYRRAQIRLDRYLRFNNQFMVTSQVSLNENIVSDLSTVTGVERESTNWPLIQGRLAFTLGNRGKGCRPIVLGAFGHIGEQGFDFKSNVPAALNPLGLPAEDDVRIETWSYGFDVTVPVTDRLTVKGEYWNGANLGTFLGGIGQGVCPCLRKAIRANGGWLDVGFDVTPRLHTHTGFGIDDPNVEEDALFGRAYNQFLFTNVSYDVTNKLNLGLELSYWKTLYFESRDDAGVPLATPSPGESYRLEFVTRYGF